MDKNIDARIVKSKKMLKNALIKLISKKSFDKINVSEICDEAKIHRMTFYNHYSDKFSLFKDAVADVFSVLEHRFIHEVYICKTKSEIDKSVDFFDLIITELGKNEHILKSISGSKDYAKLYEILRDAYEQTIYNICTKIFKEHNDQLDFRVKFYCGGISNMIMYYFLYREQINYADYKKNLRELITSLIKN